MRTGSTVGQIVARLSPFAPSERLVQISTTAATDDVILASFSIETQDVPGTLRNIKFGLHVENTTISKLFANVKMKINGITYSADTITDTTAVERNITFGNLNAILPANQFVFVTIFGDINPDVNGSLSGAMATVSLTTYASAPALSNPQVEDQAHQSINVVPGTIQGNTLTFLGP